MKEMFKGKINSPQTQLLESIDSHSTDIKVLDVSVFPEGPNLAVIGTDAQAETIKYANINNNILVGCVRGFQGTAKSWDKDSIIARNFTESDLNTIQENILELDNNKVDKVEGKELSSNDFTNDLKDKLEKIEDGANKITKISQLTNDENFKTEAEIQELINNSTKLKKEVVTSLPTTGKDDVIYLVKDEKGKENNNYLEYLWINGKYELIGSTQVDLSGYMTTKDFESKWENVRRVVNGSWNKISRIEDEIPKPFQEEYGEPSPDDKSYVTPAYANNQYLGKQDIQEFTQQELEEAFK